MDIYRSGGAAPKKPAGRSPQKKQKVEESDEEEDEEEDEDDDEDDDE